MIFSQKWSKYKKLYWAEGWLFVTCGPRGPPEPSVLPCCAALHAQIGVFGGHVQEHLLRPSDPHLQPHDAPQSLWAAQQLPCPGQTPGELIPSLHVLPGQTAGTKGRGDFQRLGAKVWTGPAGHTGQGPLSYFTVEES